MLRRNSSAPVCGAALIAGLVFIAPRVAQAQPSATYSTLSQPSGQPARRPAAKPAPAPVTASVNGAEQADYWTVKTSLPSQYTSERAKSQAKPAAGTASAGPGDNAAPLGRIPLRDTPGGSIGPASGQSARSGQFHDGRDVPGLTANTERESSYVGMSLSVSSNNKGLPIPVPVPTPWGRPE